MQPPDSLRAPFASVRRDPPVIGLVSGGLAAYWPQFPGLLEAVRQATAIVRQHLDAMNARVVDAGFVDVPERVNPSARCLILSGNRPRTESASRGNSPR